MTKAKWLSTILLILIHIFLKFSGSEYKMDYVRRKKQRKEVNKEANVEK